MDDVFSFLASFVESRLPQEAAQEAANGAMEETIEKAAEKTAQPKKPAMQTVADIPKAEKEEAPNPLKVPKLNDLPTPGSVGLLLLLILFLLFAIVPAPGHSQSRLMLIWGALLGKNKMTGEGENDLFAGPDSLYGPIVPPFPGMRGDYSDIYGDYPNFGP